MNIVCGILMNDGVNNYEVIRVMLIGFQDGGGNDLVDVLIVDVIGVELYVLGVIFYEENWGFGEYLYLIK